MRPKGVLRLVLRLNGSLSLLQPQGGADALYASPEMLQKEIGSRYSGKFVIGKDLDVY